MFDSNLWYYFSKIMCCSIPGILPFHIGPCVCPSALLPAFLGPFRIMVSCLAPNFDATLFFPEEDCAISYLQGLSISSSNPSYQNDIQASLDDQLFANVFNSSTIHDQAHLHAVVHYSGVSTGWLKAIPQPSLFSTGFFYCCLFIVGCSFFPLLLLCTCLSVIDQFGDNFLGCSHGPLHIQRYNALVSIVHHALLQNHPGGALHEQSWSVKSWRHLLWFYSRPSSLLWPL